MIEIAKKNIRSRFSRKAKQYDYYAKIQKNIADSLFKESIAPVLFSIKNPVDLSLIDLGCGTGFLLEPLKKMENIKPFVISLDFSEAMLLCAKNKYHQNGICADVHDLPIIENSFEMVVSSMMLHWTILDKAFSEIYRILKENGHFIFNLPVKGTLSHYFHEFSYNNFFNFYNIQEVINTLKKTNFIIEKYEIKKFSLIYPNLTLAIASIREIGAGTLFSKQKGFSERKKFLENMKNGEIKKDIYLNYVIFQAHARKFNAS